MLFFNRWFNNLCHHLKPFFKRPDGRPELLRRNDAGKGSVPKERDGLRWVLLLLGFGVLGCDGQPTAPPLVHDAQEVQTLRREIQAIDWDQ
jgi:hypothetical protein